MEALIGEWLSLVFRWLHVVAGIAWIGSSFYFIHLDASLKRRAGLPQGVSGEAWQVHGGGFYRMQKYMVAPAELPDAGVLRQLGTSKPPALERFPFALTHGRRA